MISVWLEMIGFAVVLELVPADLLLSAPVVVVDFPSCIGLDHRTQFLRYHRIDRARPSVHRVWTWPWYHSRLLATRRRRNQHFVAIPPKYGPIRTLGNT